MYCFLSQDLITHGDSAVGADVVCQLYTACDQTGAQLGTAVSLLELRRCQHCPRYVTTALRFYRSAQHVIDCDFMIHHMT